MQVINIRSIANALLIAFVATTSQVSNAASGSTSVSVDFPEIIILHYRSALGIRFTGGIDSAVDEGTAGTISVPIDSASGDGTVTTSGTATTSIPVKVSNMWAVRGITSSGNFKIDTTITNDTATSGTSSTTMSNIQAVAGGATGPSISVASGGLSTANAVYGGITFDLDIASVTQTGTHNGIVFTITASAP